MDRNVKTLLLLNTNLLVLVWFISIILISVFIKLDLRNDPRNRKYPGINLKEYK